MGRVVWVGAGGGVGDTVGEEDGAEHDESTKVRSKKDIVKKANLFLGCIYLLLRFNNIIYPVPMF